VLLNVGGVFMGTALTMRDLIGERAIFLREQAVGLSTSALLVLREGVLSQPCRDCPVGNRTVIALLGKGGPNTRRRGDR